MNYKLLSEAALAFVGHDNFDAQLSCALKKLVTGLQLSRAYVLIDSGERVTMGPIREWCQEGIAQQWIHDVPYTRYATWKQLLASDRQIAAAKTASLPDEIRKVLDIHGIKSHVAYPLVVNHEIGGFVGFDDCTRERAWETEELALMKAVAELVSVFYELDVLRHQATAGKLHEADGPPSIYDPLTGLHNRQHVMERLKGFDAEYARLGRNFCISIIDLDNFKSVNYSYGRDAGDYILTEFGKILNDAIRPYDICGRFGGEEFIVVSVNADASETVAMIERIMATVRSRAFVFNGMDIRMRFSCGIACGTEFTPENMSVDKMVEMANRRMYAAKQGGKDRLVSPAPV